jgi:hypothetical protein
LTSGSRRRTEVAAQTLNRRTNGVLCDHPQHDRFTAEEFTGELARHRLTARGSRTLFLGGLVPGVAEQAH